MERYDIIIIGAGIAGCSLAHQLSNFNLKVAIIEKEKESARGASGNEVGVLYPRLDASINKYSVLYDNSLKFSVKYFSSIEKYKGELFVQMPLIRTLNNASDITKYKKIDAMIQDKSLAQYVEGLTLEMPYTGILTSCSGYIFPRKIVKRLCELSKASKFFNRNVTAVYKNQEGWNAVCEDKIYTCKTLILCNSYMASKLNLNHAILKDLKPVRGQVSYIASSNSFDLAYILCGNKGYITPNIDGIHYVGATYDYLNIHSSVTDEDHAQNVKVWQAYTLQHIPIIKGGRASIRSVNPSRMPIYGPVTGFPDLFVNIAHGSRGFLSAPYCSSCIIQQLSALY